MSMFFLFTPIICADQKESIPAELAQSQDPAVQKTVALIRKTNLSLHPAMYYEGE